MHTDGNLPPWSHRRKRTPDHPDPVHECEEIAPAEWTAIARTRRPCSSGKRRAAQTMAGISRAGIYQSERFSANSLPRSIVIPGLVLMSVRR